MHYKNGREAKNGDKVLVIPSSGTPKVGILYDAVAGNDMCNGQLASPTAPTYVNLAETLHLDDVLAAVNAAAALQPGAVPQAPAADAVPTPPAAP